MPWLSARIVIGNYTLARTLRDSLVGIGPRVNRRASSIPFNSVERSRLESVPVNH
jgi:hypothetical protein